MRQLDIKESYKQLLQAAQVNSGSDYFVEISEQFANGYWKDYENILSDANLSFQDKTVVDFGCKYGHLLIYFLSKGVKSAIGVEAEPKYIEEGNRFLEMEYGDKLHIMSSHEISPVPSSISTLYMLK